MYEDDYFEDDMVNAAEMAGHQTVGTDTDTTEYVTDGLNPWGIKVGPGPTHEDEDPVNHPRHYTDHPSGVECIQITEHMNFCLGNATKYIWRAGLKSDDPVEDLLKARWYIDRELSRLGGSDA